MWLTCCHCAHRLQQQPLPRQRLPALVALWGHGRATPSAAATVHLQQEQQQQQRMVTAEQVIPQQCKQDLLALPSSKDSSKRTTKLRDWLMVHIQVRSTVQSSTTLC